jgi:hypothetical protein
LSYAFGGFDWAGSHGHYQDRSPGDIAHFRGREVILVSGIVAYALDYCGGLVRVSELLAHRAWNPPISSSLADDEACLLAPPQHGGARFPTLAANRSGGARLTSG